MKIGASMLATEDRTIEEALEYFDSNKHIDYVEIVHDYPYREINDDNELIDLINSYDLKYTIHAPFIDINIASLNPAVADFSFLDSMEGERKNWSIKYQRNILKSSATMQKIVELMHALKISLTSLTSCLWMWINWMIH